MAKSTKSTQSAVVASTVAPSSVADDQCFDWTISIPEGVARKRVQVKFPVDMRMIRAKEKAKREALDKNASRKREYVVAVKGGQPQLAHQPQASKVTIGVVASIFVGLLVVSIGVFSYFMVQAGYDEQE